MKHHDLPLIAAFVALLLGIVVGRASEATSPVSQPVIPAASFGCSGIDYSQQIASICVDATPGDHVQFAMNHCAIATGPHPDSQQSMVVGPPGRVSFVWHLVFTCLTDAVRVTVTDASGHATNLNSLLVYFSPSPLPS